MSDAELQARYRVIDYPGSKLLYGSATGFEKAMADVDAERVINLPDWVITDQWDPYLISYNNLPYLAWGMGTNLWEADYWSEGTKRNWVAYQWRYKSLRGTPAGIRMALGQSGYDVIDMVRPPQGFWASNNLTKEEWDNWIRLMPQLRIQFALRQGTRGVDEFFIDNPDTTTEQAQTGFLDQDYIGYDDGWALYGREAVLRQNGVDTPLNSVTFDKRNIDLPAVDYERFSTVGRSTDGFFVDESATDVDYICVAQVEPKLYTLALDRSYVHDTSVVGLDTIVPTLEPLTPRYERNSDVGVAGPVMFLDADYIEGPEGFIDREDGGDRLLADFLYLLDPGIQEPMNVGVSFLDISRIGLEPYLAEVQVDLHTKEEAPAWFVGLSYIDHDFLVPEDTSHIDRAIRAINDAKALRDTILVSFAPRRPLQMGDYVQDTATYDTWVRDPL